MVVWKTLMFGLAFIVKFGLMRSVMQMPSVHKNKKNEEGIDTFLNHPKNIYMCNF